MQEAIADHIFEGMKRTNMWTADCPVALERLSVVHFDYVDFEGQEHGDGEIVVFDAAVPSVESAFKKIFARRFPMARARSVHHYQGNDEASMADNNTSCFNHRPIEGTSLASLHSYGLAVDVNPVQNPFVVFDEDKGTAIIHPSQGWSFLNRHNQKPGMVEEIVSLWAEHGFFIWGGRWTTPIDFHHFQTTRGMAELLVQMNVSDGERFFQLCIENREKWKTMPPGEPLRPLIALYHESREKFFKQVVRDMDRLVSA